MMLTNFLLKFDQLCINMGYVVAQMVEAQRYKLAGQGFDSQRFQWNFSST
jgi:hypothetical protein